MSAAVVRDEGWMLRAAAAADGVRCSTAPNPWVGAVVVTAAEMAYVGATEPPGGRHAEIVALDAARLAGAELAGSTVYVTLEPCCHVGRTAACTDALIAADVGRVVVGVVDPDTRVAGRGLERLRSAGIVVTLGIGKRHVEQQLRPYLHHRTVGRPFVVLKTASTLDGRTSAADGSSRWITSDEARREAHRLRAESQAVCVGAGTVRADDPALTVRHVEGSDPLRVVVGKAPATANVHPCLEWTGELPGLLDHLASLGVLQLLVEGGARLAASFHRQGLIDRYVVHLAPALGGGDGGSAMFAGAAPASITDLWRGTIVGTRLLGPDLEVVLER